MIRRHLIVLIFILNGAAVLGQNFNWAKAAGGKGNDVSNAIKVEGSSIYITGSFKGNALFDSATITSNGEDDVFIAKYTDTNRMQWVKSFGGKGEDVANGMDIDVSGNIYIVGYFNGNITVGNTLLTSYGSDVFIAKYGSAGNFIWAKKAGGTDNDYAYAVNTDASGNVYVTGDFSGTANFDNISITSNGMKDGFIAKYDSLGSLQWVQKVGGKKDDAINAVYVTSANVFLTGSFTDSAKFESKSVASNGGSDIFIAKYSASGNIEWVKKAGGKSNDAGNGIKKDGFGNLYVTGNFRSNASFDDTTLTGNGGSDMFIAKYNPFGNLLWVRQAGGNENEESNGICLDGFGNAYVTGSFKNNMRFQRTDIYSDEGTDIFIVKYDSIGNFKWVQKASGIANDLALGIDIDRAGNLYITGVFKELARFGKTKLFAAGASDIFIAKIEQITEERCICKEGKNVLKWQPFSNLVGYWRVAYERVISDRNSFQLEIGGLHSQIDHKKNDTLLFGATGYLITYDYLALPEYRHYLNAAPRGFYYGSFLRIKTGTNEFMSLNENGSSLQKSYYKERSFSLGLGESVGFQYVFRFCLTVDAFFGLYIKAGSTYGRVYYSEFNSDEKIKTIFPSYVSFEKEGLGLGGRLGLKLGYTF